MLCQGVGQLLPRPTTHNIPSELPLRECTDIPLCHRLHNRHCSEGKTVESSKAHCSATSAQEQVLLGAVSETTSCHDGTGNRNLASIANLRYPYVTKFITKHFCKPIVTYFDDPLLLLFTSISGQEHMIHCCKCCQFQPGCKSTSNNLMLSINNRKKIKYRYHHYLYIQ